MKVYKYFLCEILCINIYNLEDQNNKNLNKKIVLNEMYKFIYKNKKKNK